MCIPGDIVDLVSKTAIKVWMSVLKDSVWIYYPDLSPVLSSLSSPTHKHLQVYCVCKAGDDRLCAFCLRCSETWDDALLNNQWVNSMDQSQ